MSSLSVIVGSQYGKWFEDPDKYEAERCLKEELRREAVLAIERISAGSRLSGQVEPELIRVEAAVGVV